MYDDQMDPESVLLLAMEWAFRGPEYKGTQTTDWQAHMKRVLQCVRENDPAIQALYEALGKASLELAQEQKRYHFCWNQMTQLVEIAETRPHCPIGHAMQHEVPGSYRAALGKSE